MLRNILRTVPRMVTPAIRHSAQPSKVLRMVQPVTLTFTRNLDIDRPEMEVVKKLKLNDFEKAKLRRKFHLYDIDDNYHIEHEDYETYINRIKAAYDLKEGDPLLHAFQNEFEAHWQRMLKFMDENKDGQLSVDEWMDYYPKITTTFRAKTYENLPKFLQTLADAFFKLMDSKGDDIIDAEEYCEFWNKWDPKNQITLETAHEHINHMSQNGKYTMDLDHFRELHADYTWSKDPKTFGKYAYGPIDDGKK